MGVNGRGCELQMRSMAVRFKGRRTGCTAERVTNRRPGDERRWTQSWWDVEMCKERDCNGNGIGSESPNFMCIQWR
jgi:hypothetical protein